MFLVIGALIVIGSVAGGFTLHGGNLLTLWQPSELLIIGGAAVGSIVISTPWSVLKLMARQVGGFFSRGETKSDYLELLGMLYQIFKLIQQSGVMALETHFEEPAKSAILAKYPKFLARHQALDFLADSVKVIIIGGISAHDLESLMDEDIEVHHHQSIRPSQVLAKIGDSLPGMGIVAAVLGVVMTMAAIDGPAQEIGEKVGAALVGTFLGILMCYGFVSPMASFMEGRVNDDGRYVVCIKTGLLAVYKGFPPAIAVEFARRVLPNEVRPAFDETETYCKTGMAQAQPVATDAAA